MALGLEQRALKRIPGGQVVLAAGGVALAAVPFVIDAPHVWDLGIRICYYLLLVMSWNLISGFAGLFSFGHVAFAAIGAYTSAIVVAKTGLPIAVGMALGTLLAGIAGLALGSLSLRIRGPYLVVVSFAFLSITQIVILAQRDLTGGASGMLVPMAYPIGAPDRWYLLGVALVAVYLFLQRLALQSHWRHNLLALRDNEYAAVAMGGRPWLWKLSVFTASAAVAGLAGGYLGHSVGLILPRMGGFEEMSLVVAMGLLGGIGTIVGPVVGTVLLLVADDQLRATAGALSSLLFGLVLLAVVAMFPRGLSGLGGKLLAAHDGDLQPRTEASRGREHI